MKLSSGSRKVEETSKISEGVKNYEFIQMIRNELDNEADNSKVGGFIVEHLSEIVGLSVSFSELYNTIGFIGSTVEKLYMLDCMTSSKNSDKLRALLDIYIYYGMGDYLEETVHKLVSKMRVDSYSEYIEYFDFNSRKLYSAMMRYDRQSKDFLSCRFFNIRIFPEYSVNMLNFPYVGLKDRNIAFLGFNNSFVILRLPGDKKCYIAKFLGENTMWKVATESELEYVENMGYIKCELPDFETEEGKLQAIARYSRY